jgi:two-component system response regulator YesN
LAHFYYSVYSSLIERIKYYIINHYNEDITLQQLALKFFINPSYLSQIFKKETGITLSSFLEDVRLIKAKELLTNLTVDIGDIAARVGYNDSNYFSKVFKKKFGMSPTQYQRISGSKT